MLALASFIVLLTLKGFKCKVNRPSAPTRSFFQAHVSPKRWQKYILVLKAAGLERMAELQHGNAKVGISAENKRRISLSSAEDKAGKVPCNRSSTSSVCKVSVHNRCSFCAEVKNKLWGMEGKKKSWETNLGISLWPLWISGCVEEWNSQILKQEMPVHSHHSSLFSPFRTQTFPTPLSGLFSFLKWAKLCLLLTIPGEKNGVLLCVGIWNRVFSLFR